MAISETELASELRELIAALDRRASNLENAGEAAIARDAAELRSKAIKRLEELALETTCVGAASAPHVQTV